MVLLLSLHTFERVLMSDNKIAIWIKSNRDICYLIVFACFLLFNGFFLFRTIGFGSRSVLVFAGICAIVFCIICVFYYFIKGKSTFIHRVFLVMLLALGTMYSLVFQPIGAPDENYHFESSYKYSDYLMLKSADSELITVRVVDADLLNRMSELSYLSYSHYAEITENFEFRANSFEETTMTPISSFPLDSNPPQLKLPSAIGITIARLLGLGMYPLFYLGRFFNFLLFALLCFFAVKITPVGKNAFMAIALLPMTLHITSSYSYDAGIIGLSFLLVALCLKAIYNHKHLSYKDFIAIAVVAVLLAPCKALYSLLVFVVILVPAAAFSSKRNSILYKTGVIILSFGSVLAFRLPTLLSITGISRTDISIRGTEQNYLHTITEFFTDPFETITIFFRSLDANGDFYLSSTIGGTLGWFQWQLVAPWFVVIAFLIVLLLSFLKTPNDTITIPFRHRILFFIISCLGMFAIMLSMFTGWTFSTENVIAGVQGRYLLPFVPLAALVLRSNVIVSQKSLKVLILFGILALNLAYLTRIYAVITTIT